MEPVEGSSNLFTINHTNPQLVLIKGNTITFENGNSYNLNDPDLAHFITNTQIDREINNFDLIYNFLIDMKYNFNYGDKKSDRYNTIKNLFQQLHYQEGRGLKFVFLPSDPNELVDKLKLLTKKK